ncbi:MAG: ribosome assembly RNA-binding protein YhbY [Oscillospiraceae bacterium]|jgi:RNA-binding protein|nr:ribosome assembly RNA-binding protein YhbY [Oscillospiraceae bacterium]
MLISKHRAFLKSLAHDADTVLMVGKSGIIDTLIAQADGVLEARELIKGKVLESSPVTVKEAAERLAQATRSEVVQTIGRKFVLFRRNNEKPVIELPKVRRK